VQRGKTQWFGSPQLRSLVNLQIKRVPEQGPSLSYIRPSENTQMKYLL
jgi:hypothetical protein